MKKFLLEMLECPLCHHELTWQIDVETEAEVEQAEATCVDCKATYPVTDGIGIFLTPDLPRNDLWEQVDSQLAAYLKAHPEEEKKLMDTPVESLSPTDQHFRALVLDERGDYGEARKVEQLANQNIYTMEYNRCWDSQVDHVVDQLSAVDGPIVDLASGRCYLVEQLASRLGCQVVATDFSPSVLRRDRAYFNFLGLDHLVSFLAFDARKTPFKDGVVKNMTTNLGLPNIEDPGDLVSELDRVIGGTFLAISHFFPVDDDVNRTLIEQAGVEAFVYKGSLLQHFSSSGGDVKLENVCIAHALPTPESEIIEGARADGLPVGPTELEWCTVRFEGKA